MAAERDTNPDDESLDADGVAELLGCSPSHVRALVRRKAFIAPAKLGALARWSRSAVLAWLRENTGRVVDRAGKSAEVRG